MLERELKIAAADLTTIEARLRELGAAPTGPVVQEDTYLGHPSRDFTHTDEALRIRRVGDTYELTYKGPKQPGDAKVREELTTAADAQTEAVLAAAGFTVAARLRKTRTTYAWKDVEVALDQVDDVGTFVEIEGDADLDLVARGLGLDPAASTTLSYLELRQRRSAR